MYTVATVQLVVTLDGSVAVAEGGPCSLNEVRFWCLYVNKQLKPTYACSKQVKFHSQNFAITTTVVSSKINPILKLEQKISIALYSFSGGH